MIQNPFFPEIHGNFGFGCMRLPMKDGHVDYDEFCRMADVRGFSRKAGPSRYPFKSGAPTQQSPANAPGKKPPGSRDRTMRPVPEST